MFVPVAIFCLAGFSLWLMRSCISFLTCGMSLLLLRWLLARVWRQTYSFLNAGILSHMSCVCISPMGVKCSCSVLCHPSLPYPHPLISGLTSLDLDGRDYLCLFTIMSPVFTMVTIHSGCSINTQWANKWVNEWMNFTFFRRTLKPIERMAKAH